MGNTLEDTFMLINDLLKHTHIPKHSHLDEINTPFLVTFTYFVILLIYPVEGREDEEEPHMCHSTKPWRSEDNLQWLILSRHCVDPRDQTQVSALATSWTIPLALAPVWVPSVNSLTRHRVELTEKTGQTLRGTRRSSFKSPHCVAVPPCWFYVCARPVTWTGMELTPCRSLIIQIFLVNKEAWPLFLQ